MRKCILLVFLVMFIAAGLFANEIGRVEQARATFVVFSPTGSRISSTNIGRGEHTLAGWGRDFFVVQNGNAIYTHDPQGRQIANWNSGPAGIGRITITFDTVTSTNRIAVFPARGDSPSAILDRSLRDVPGAMPQAAPAPRTPPPAATPAPAATQPAAPAATPVAPAPRTPPPAAR